MRSLAASAIGEVIFTITAYFNRVFRRGFPLNAHRANDDFLYHEDLCWFDLVTPSSLIAALLKKIESIDQENSVAKFKIEGKNF